jgi:ketosteroid isomerase-like protein
MFAASPDVQAQVLAVLDRMNALMAVGDCDGQRAQFADDADVAMVGSADFEVFLNAEGVDAYFALVRDHNVTASWAWKERRVWASGDIAWAYADSDFTYTLDGTEQTLPYRLTMVCQRRDGEWRIVLFHGSEPAIIS